MKDLIIYYSRTGNTRILAEVIKDKLDADILEVKDVLQKKGFFSYIKAGFFAGRKKQTVITPEKINTTGYDRIFIGTPIWSWTFVPAIRTVLNNTDLKGKTVVPFATMGGSDLTKIEENIKSLLIEKGAKPSRLISLKTGGLKKEKIQEKAKERAKDIT